MGTTLADLASERASETLVGRQQELATLRTLLDQGGPVIGWMHGIAGVGKSALLDVFLRQARAAGATVLLLNGRAIEPIERGFLDALRAAIASRGAATDDVMERLAELGPQIILAIDNFELIRLLDTWLRQEFVPSLPDSVRVLLVGREAPSATWREAPGWSDLFLDLRLASLSDAAADELLARIEVPENQRRWISRVARGHPLALRVAAAATKTRNELDLEHLADEAVIDVLTQLYLRDLDPTTRSALDAACVIRRTTVSLLGALLPERAPQDVFDRLRSLPFVELGADGLVIHDAVQKVVADTLKAVDPARHTRYRQAAWRQLRSEVRTAGLSDLWRYTADLLYLVENPIVREAFFPSSSSAYAVESARPEDAPAIEEILRTYASPSMVTAILSLWGRLPSAFRVARDRPGTVAGFYIAFEAHTMSPAWLDVDPILRAYWRHLRDVPIPSQQRALFFRLLLDREKGDRPGAVQAACWLDVKRMYMELRPNIRRVYTAISDLATYQDVLNRLGFHFYPCQDVTVDAIQYYPMVNDFGPASVDGWLSSLLARELGVDQAELLAIPERQLVLDGHRIDLSRLEFDVMHFLYEHEGRPVSRNTIMEAVWGHDTDTDSNVLQAVVKSLRKKMGTSADMIETVRGVGYRFRRLK